MIQNATQCRDSSVLRLENESTTDNTHNIFGNNSYETHNSLNSKIKELEQVLDNKQVELKSLKSKFLDICGKIANYENVIQTKTLWNKKQLKLLQNSNCDEAKNSQMTYFKQHLSKKYRVVYNTYLQKCWRQDIVDTIWQNTYDIKQAKETLPNIKDIRMEMNSKINNLQSECNNIKQNIKELKRQLENSGSQQDTQEIEHDTKSNSSCDTVVNINFDKDSEQCHEKFYSVIGNIIITQTKQQRVKMYKQLPIDRWIKHANAF